MRRVLKYRSGRYYFLHVSKAIFCFHFRNKVLRAFTLSSSNNQLSDQKENIRGEQVPVCDDCKGLVMEITSSSKQTRSSARNRALKNLTLDLSPVYK